MAPLLMSFSVRLMLQWAYTEAPGLVEVSFNIFNLDDFNQFMSYPQVMPFL